MSDDSMEQLRDFVRQLVGLVEERRSKISAAQVAARAVVQTLGLAYESIDRVLRPLQEAQGILRHASTANQATVAEQVMGFLARCSDRSEYLLADEQKISAALAVLVTSLAALDLCEQPFPGGPHLFTQLVAATRPLAKKLVEPGLGVADAVQILQTLIAQQRPMQQS